MNKLTISTFIKQIKSKSHIESAGSEEVYCNNLQHKKYVIATEEMSPTILH